ncbi:MULTISPECIES: GNAT family N-acetyltransferase [Ensifer]|jgi:GNAT superfamily N-acetyltransferase|uniref:GNAT family N-acetyltransferase n=1 Tax=Ensifer TaxID=106591 RepID=UPI0009C6B2DA|nr:MULTISPECIES: GNAT family N-acetyltransferase [Ensifer]NOV14807.1 GNAT family N-acetyltransferase [Ensifer canadensis]OMQ45742.1 GNAT family N-acetyltransferase [Ensifer sp. 1H6]PSS63339.1 N-acetyltransferase [Ensifer sp. NM-2]
MHALTDLDIRKAERADLPAIIALFAADDVGGHGDTVEPEAFDDYLAAFARIEASPLQTLYVARLGEEVVGTFQATLLTSLPGRGRPRLLIEAVQTRKDMRGRGIGARMIRHASERAREEGAAKVQLSSNATRTDAHRFYERLGFVRSHFGFHMPLK